MREEIIKIDNLNTVKALLEYAEKNKQIKNSSHVHLFGKISNHIGNTKGDSRDKIVRTAEFQNYFDELKLKYREQNLSESMRVQILNSMLKMNFRDLEMLRDTCEYIKKGQISNISSITNILYVLAKFHYKPLLDQGQEDKEVMEKCVKIFKSELVLPVSIVCRNLWNFYGLHYFDKDLYDKFSTVIVSNHDKLNEIDIANAFKSFAHFNYVNYPVLEVLIKNTIQNCHTYKL
jgi:hypothetical protein